MLQWMVELGTVDICPDVLMAALATVGALAFLALQSAISAAAMTRRRRNLMRGGGKGDGVEVGGLATGVWPIGNVKRLLACLARLWT